MGGWLAVFVVGGFAALCLAATRGRWLARWPHGFGILLGCTVVGSGLATAVAVGEWGYEHARDTAVRQRVEALEGLEAAVGDELRGEVDRLVEKLQRLATPAFLDEARGDPVVARRELDELLTFNARLLQINVLDADGKVLAASDGRHEPVNRVGMAHALEGKPYVSDPYPSDVFGREVLYVSVPAKGADGTILGAVTLRVDLERIVSDVVSPVRFGSSGRAIVVDGQGRVVASADRSQLGSNLSGSATLKAITADDSGRDHGWAWATIDGSNRLVTWRQLDGISRGDRTGGPMVMLAEMDVAEVLAPVRAMGRTFAKVGAVVCLAWAVLGWKLAGLLTRPLRELEGAVKRVESGDLETRIPPQTAGRRDEIGQFAAAFNAMVAGLQERDRVKKVFGRYVTSQVADTILRGNGELGGQKKRVTILFADIRNFTTMSEQMAPEKVVAFLNEYFSEMVEAVFECGGVLDKFIGDGMMAVFGAVDDLPDPEQRAVKAGLRMKAKLAKLNGQRAVEGKPPIDIGIGIHTDEVVVGNIGSADRQDYTVIGDGVNTCSRVESANKELGTTLLVTGQTREKLGDSFECRPMPAAKLKGKAREMVLFEVVSARAA